MPPAVERHALRQRTRNRDRLFYWLSPLGAMFIACEAAAGGTALASSVLGLRFVAAGSGPVAAELFDGESLSLLNGDM